MEKQPESVCLRCDGKMEALGTKKILLRRPNLLTESDDFIISDSVDLEVYKCRTCGRLEFYSICDPDEDYGEDDVASAGESGDGEHIAKVTCPQCGNQYDMDYPRCPFCGTAQPESYENCGKNDFYEP